MAIKGNQSLWHSLGICTCAIVCVCGPKVGSG